MQAIGQIQAKVTKCCTVCGSARRQTVAVKITEKTDEQVAKAKQEIANRIQKPYTCGICKSITREMAQ